MGSLSPATSPQKIQAPVPIKTETRFDLGNGQTVAENDLHNLEKLAHRLFGDQGRYKPGAPFGDVPKGERWLQVQAGALLVLGQGRLQVLAFQAVEMTLQIAGRAPAVYRIPRHRQPAYRAPRGAPIRAVQVQPLHPVYREAEYKEIYSSRVGNTPGSIQVPLKNHSLFMWEEHHRMLCHCGVWFSRRSGMLAHLQSNHLGLPDGPIKSRPPPPQDKVLTFEKRVSGHVSTDPVWVPSPTGEWFGTITFASDAVPGERQLKSGSPRLVLTPATFFAVPGQEVSVTARVQGDYKHPPMRKEFWCLFVTLTVARTDGNSPDGCIHDIRLPHLTNKTLADPNAIQHRIFAAPPSKALARPVLTVAGGDSYYAADDALQELAGPKKRLITGARHYAVVKKLKHVKEQTFFAQQRPAGPARF